MKRKLATLADSQLEQGDFVIFQVYEAKTDIYKVHKPKVAIFLNYDILDQALAFNYVLWLNPSHQILNDSGYMDTKQPEINGYVEWSDTIDILAHFKYKPKFKEILEAFRNQNLSEEVKPEDIEI